MAGFIAVCAPPSHKPDQSKFRMSLQAGARDSGLHSSTFTSGSLALGVWRRHEGEFPESGMIFEGENRVVAWIGQTIDDAGDSTNRTIDSVLRAGFEEIKSAINGPFALVEWSTESSELRLITDRHRHYPIYVYQSDGLIAASTELHCLFPWLRSRSLDLSAVDLLLRSGELIDRMTLVSGIDLLPPGTVLRVHEGKVSERRYWKMRHDGRTSKGFKEVSSQLAEALRRSVRRIEAAAPNLGITLSGGLDSRIILDLCRQPERVPSFTWGLDGCRDIDCARHFAASVGSPHTIRQWVPEHFPPLWENGVRITAGSFGVESMYMLPFVDLLASNCSTVLNGLAGDAILGGNFIKYAWLREPSLAKLAYLVWRWRVTPDEEQLVDSLMPGSSGIESRGRWVSSISMIDNATPLERVHDWLYENRVFRNTNSGTMLLRSRVESHSPFFDNDFVDLVTTVNQSFKFKHRLYLEVMNNVAPRAASVPWQRTALAPRLGFTANFLAMGYHRVLTRLGQEIGFNPFPHLPVADPAGWFRSGWRSPAESILLDSRTLERGVFCPDGLSSMLSAHASGRNFSRQIGVAIAVELFARQLHTEGL